MTEIDDTHDPARQSWVPGADNHAHFPIQNLTIGIYAPPGGIARPGIAIGDHILDLRAVRHELGPEAERALAPATGDGLNDFLAQGAQARRAVRRAVSALLTRGHSAERHAAQILHPASDCTLELPAAIGDYTDFYAGIHHATAVGKLFRPDNPLLPNYKHLPIAYHGRTSSLRVSGTPIRRPSGQQKPADAATPEFAPTKRLDYELELAIWIGPGNDPETPIPIEEAASHIAGYGLLNDWSARDLQAWEYQPLGPFLAKSFATTISPWIITPEALAPFRAPQPPRPQGDPHPLPYLWSETDQREGALNLRLQTWLRTKTLEHPHQLAESQATDLYWTPAQMVVHHTSNGCNLRPGDLFGTGTISGPASNQAGSLLELSAGGRTPLALPNGESRRFLEDGDEVIMRAFAERDGYVSIGFGECAGRIVLS